MMTTPLNDDHIQRLRYLVQQVNTAAAELDAYLEKVISLKHAVSSDGKAVAASRSRQRAKDDGKDIADRAEALLKDVLDCGSVNRKNLSLPVTKALLKEKTKNKPFADAVKAKVLDEAWQEEQDWLEVSQRGDLSLREL